MKNTKSILKFKIFSIIFASILGTLLHFTFEWSDNNLLVAGFSSVNESTWEHLKLIFFPMLLTTIMGYFYIGKNISNFLCVRTIGIITSMLFIIIFFYTYTGIIGTNIPIIDITSFFVSIILGECISYKIIMSDFLCNKKIAIIILLILLLCFIFFTYFTPRIGLFKDPVTNQYGIINV